MTIIRKTRPKPEPVPEEPKPAQEVSKPPKWNPDGEAIPVDAFIRIREVIKLTGLSRATVYRKIEKERFPKPIHPSKHTSAWVRAEVLRWMSYQVAKSH